MATIKEQLAEAKRECALRESVYPRWIADGKLKPDLAKQRLEASKSIVQTLEGLLKIVEAANGSPGQTPEMFPKH